MPVKSKPVQVKICGTTSVADARLAQEAGADFLGVIIIHLPSPRHVVLMNVKEIMAAAEVPVVLLTVNQPIETLVGVGKMFRPHAFQLHGDESPETVRQLVNAGFKVWKAISGDEDALLEAAKKYRDAGAEAILVDARETSPDGVVYGGTGKLADWGAARRLVDEGYRIILAGGLSPENVERAIEAVQPWAVDVVSGVEASKGVKDADKLREFVRRATS